MSSLTLPQAPEQFGKLTEPERVLTAMAGWNRFFRYPEGETEAVHVVATADGLDDEILFYRIDLNQARPTSRRALRPAAEIVGGGIMTYEQCTEWLIELSFKLANKPDEALRQIILSRPRQLKPIQIRIAWIGPEIVEATAMPQRLLAIGRVYGVEILHIPPRGYRDVVARLREALPLDSTIICNQFAPFVHSSAVPDTVRQNLVYTCDSKTRQDLEAQVRAWAEITVQEIEKERHHEDIDQNKTLLKIMLRGMLSHSKIGQFSHCPKTTVLKGIRGRHLDVPLAEHILERNSEVFQDTKSGDTIFLWKEHCDGRQYFLNPSKMDSIKIIVAG